MACTFFSPAKVNLFLRVVSRRHDGFHDIASLFQAISLGDRLTFSFAAVDTIRCSNHHIPVDGNNLVMKALMLFRAKTGFDRAVCVDIEKNIPIEAGLGGGSSDAATTLWALNYLAGTPVTVDLLAQWGAEIGSDVSFFFSKGTALCTGRGDVITPVQSLPTTQLVIVKPSQGLSTPKVYEAFDRASIASCNAEGILSSFYGDSPLYSNDLEMPAFSLMPSLVSLKETLLLSGYDTVLMSGSGTSFFCIGNGIIPKIPGCSIFKASFITRDEGCWYQDVDER